MLNEFRTTLPSRLPHIEPLSSQDSPVRNEVSLVTQQYRDLLNRANNLSDRLSGVGGRQREYGDALGKAQSWLRDVEPRVGVVLNEPIAGDPKGVEDQLQNAKTLNNEFVANGRLIDNAKQVRFLNYSKLSTIISLTYLGNQFVIKFTGRSNFSGRNNPA